MLKSRKHVFWEAFFVAGLIFVFGLMLGVAFENYRVSKITDYYVQSEISLMDVLLMSQLVELNSSNCDGLINMNLDFADRIYEEARVMEMYADAGRINEESFWIVHKRYDLLRSFLWANSQRISERCPESNFSSVVYLYEYKTEDINQNAAQNVWAKVLFDLKIIYGDEIVLIPIAIDSELVSLQGMTAGFNLEKFPVVIINNKHVIKELSSAEELGKFVG